MPIKKGHVCVHDGTGTYRCLSPKEASYLVLAEGWHFGKGKESHIKARKIVHDTSGRTKIVTEKEADELVSSGKWWFGRGRKKNS